MVEVGHPRVRHRDLAGAAQANPGEPRYAGGGIAEEGVGPEILAAIAYADVAGDEDALTLAQVNLQLAAEIVPRKAGIASPFRRRRSEGVAARVELADVTLDRIAVKEVLEGRDCRVLVTGLQVERVAGVTETRPSGRRACTVCLTRFRSSPNARFWLAVASAEALGKLTPFSSGTTWLWITSCSP